MYTKIAVPVDLAHTEKLDKALKTAANLSRQYDAPVYLVAVTAPGPTELAHNPREFDQKLQEFAANCSTEHGAKFRFKTAVSTDPAVDLDNTLDAEFHEMGIDLVVMASHVPGFREYILSSNAGYLASHSDLSVFVVR